MLSKNKKQKQNSAFIQFDLRQLKHTRPNLKKYILDYNLEMSAAISDDFYSDGKRHYGTLENQSDSIKKPLIDKPKGNSKKYLKLLLQRICII